MNTRKPERIISSCSKEAQEMVEALGFCGKNMTKFTMRMSPNEPVEIEAEFLVCSGDMMALTKVLTKYRIVAGEASCE